MRHSRRQVLNAAVVATITTSSTVAIASECVDAPAPAACYLDAGRAIQSSNPGEAAKLFLASYRVDPTKIDPLASYGTALAKDQQYVFAAEALEKAMEAYESLMATLRDDPGTSAATRDALTQRVELIRDTLNGISSRVAHVELTVRGGKLPDGVVVTRKGGTDLRSSNPSRLVVKPDGDIIVITSANAQPREMAVIVAAGTTEVIDLRGSITEGDEDSDDSERMGPSLRYVYVAGVVGGALVVGGLGFGLHARSKWNGAFDDGHCNAMDRCDAIGLAAVDSARSSATISTVLVGAGIVGIGAGVVLWLRTRTRHESTATSVVPFAGDGAMGGMITGTL